MTIASSIREVFGHFQNLNLLALLHDLRDDRTARQAWSSGTLLCPIAHGLPDGQQVQRLTILGQITQLEQDFDFAARLIGADTAAVRRFVRSWDDEAFSREWLFWQLHELWQERLSDAEAVQELLQSSSIVQGTDCADSALR